MACGMALEQSSELHTDRVQRAFLHLGFRQGTQVLDRTATPKEIISAPCKHSNEVAVIAPHRASLWTEATPVLHPKIAPKCLRRDSNACIKP